MKKIPFTSGELTQLPAIGGELFYNLVLFNNGKQVYKGTIDQPEADKYLSKYPSLIILKKLS